MGNIKYFLIFNKSIVFFTMLLFSNFICVKAQNNTDTIKSKALNDVVITGQIGESTLKNSVFKVKVIDLKRINLQGAYNLPSLLQNELNIRMNYDPTLGNSINLQGISGQNIKVMIDGVPVIGREGGSIDLAQINLANVERIEMIEGPMAVNFGSDAMGGVINIITKKVTKKQTKIGFGSYAESIGQLNFDFNLSTTFKKIGIQTNFLRNFFQGYSNNTDPNSRTSLWKPRTQYNGDLNFSYFLKKGTIRLNNNFFDENVVNKGEPTINSFEATATDQIYYTRRLGSSLLIDLKINKKWSFNSIVAFQNYKRVKHSFFKDLISSTETIINDAELQDTNTFNLYMSRGYFSNSNVSKKFNYQIGYEVNIDEVFGTKIKNGYAAIGDFGLFGTAEIKVNKNLLIRPAARFIYNTQFTAPIIPSLNFKYDFNTVWSLRASYARGFRAPSLKELHLAFLDPQHNIRGNSQLKAETGNNFQFSLLNTHKLFKNYNLVVEPMFFYNKIYNMIDLVRLNANTVDVQYNNINDFENFGLNLNTSLTSNNVSLQLGYAFSSRQNSVNENKGFENYFYSHEYRINTSYTFTKTETSISLFFKYNGRMQNYQYSISENKIILGSIDDYSLMDCSVNKYFFKRKLNVTLGSKNVFNTINVQANLISGPHGNANNSALIGMGRTFFLTMKLNLDFLTTSKSKTEKIEKN